MSHTVISDPGETPALPTRAKIGLLWSYARPHRAILFAGVCLALVGTATELATPMVAKVVLDGLEVSASLRGPVTALAVLLVAGTVIALVQLVMLGTLAERIILATRTGMVGHLLRVRVPELAQRSSGELVARVTSDTLLIREATTSSIVNGVNGVVGLVGALVLMGVLDPLLLVTTFVAVAGAGTLAGLLMPALSRAQQDAQAEVGSMGGRLEGVLRAIRTVKASRAEQRETERIGEYARRSADKGIRAIRIQAVAWTVTGAGANLAILLVLGVGAWRVSDGSMTVSALIAFLLYAFQMLSPINLLIMSITALQAGLAAAARISEVNDMTLEQDDAAPPKTDPKPTSNTLVFDNVRFRYAPDAAFALDGISITIPRYGHTALVGPSGAGKTTIFSLLLKFLRPDGGEIHLDGRSFAHWPLQELRSRIAYVEQDTPLVPGTLYDNITYAAPHVTEDDVRRALAQVGLHERIDTLPGGLHTEIMATTLSGGERQRIALARALVADPELLLLDEVTAQLDGITEAAVAEAIRRQSERGAVVTIAHRLSTVMDADRIIVLERGKVRAIGTHSSLLETDELYQELVAALRITGGEPQPLDA